MIKYTTQPVDNSVQWSNSNNFKTFPTHGFDDRRLCWLWRKQTIHIWRTSFQKMEVKDVVLSVNEEDDVCSDNWKADSARTPNGRRKNIVGLKRQWLSLQKLCSRWLKRWFVWLLQFKQIGKGDLECIAKEIRRWGSQIDKICSQLLFEVPNGRWQIYRGAVPWASKDCVWSHLRMYGFRWNLK